MEEVVDQAVEDWLVMMGDLWKYADNVRYAMCEPAGYSYNNSALFVFQGQYYQGIANFELDSLDLLCKMDKRQSMSVAILVFVNQKGRHVYDPHFFLGWLRKASK